MYFQSLFSYIEIDNEMIKFHYTIVIAVIDGRQIPIFLHASKYVYQFSK